MRVLTKVIIGILVCTPVFGQIAPTQSVATTDDIFALRWNPAGLVVNEGFQFGMAGSFEAQSPEDVSYYLSSGTGEGAAGLSFYKPGQRYRYRFVSSTALARGMYLGYGITFGKAWHPAWSLGLLLRPLPFLSLGAVGDNLTTTNNQPLEYRTGVALRPFGNRFTVGADFLMNSDGRVLDREFTLTSELIDGVTLDAFYLQESQSLGIGVGLNLRHHQIQAVQEFADNGAVRYPDPIGVYRFSSARKRSVLSPVHRDKFILMEFDGPIPEEHPRFTLFGARGRTLTQLILQIRKYSGQPDVAGIVLAIDNPRLGPAQVNEIRRALEQFKSTGKKVYAFLESGSNLNYLLASVADRIYLNPAGDLWLTGIASQLIYVKSLLQKIGVQAEFIRIGEYKTTGEMFTRDSASTANLEQLNAYLDDFYSSFTRAISRSRALPLDTVKALIDRGPYGANRALKTGLVDSLLYRDEFKQFIKEGQGTRPHQLLSEKEYADLHAWKYDWEIPLHDKIAVIYAVGPITTGESNRSPFTGSTNMGAETIAKALRDAREHPMVKAVVLRV
ncbi:MAG TPA: S49 family peptidase, partial [bacterium]|nr:S49 family peptidase [bacterium]